MNKYQLNFGRNMENKEILKVDNVTTLIKEKFLVKNVSFSLHAGEIIGIIGEDKSGKSSLLKVITEALPVTEGNIYLDGKSVIKNKKLQRSIDICLDPPMFFKFQTIQDNMQYISSLNDEFKSKDIDEMLTKFNLMDKKKVPVRKLNFFEKKRMALALAFIRPAKVIILDEPFKSLDDQFKKQVKMYIKELSKKGSGFLLTGRDVEELQDICHTFIFLENKQIVKIMTNTELKNFQDDIIYTFIKTKTPNYAGKLVKEKFNEEVKILNNRVLLSNVDEEKTAEIVKFLTQNKIEILSAGTISTKAEQIFASLTPLFKEDEE